MASGEDIWIKNFRLFISLYETKNAAEKKENIERCLDDGADINANDANNKHNTPLHIAVQKGERDIVQLLIEKGASLDKLNAEGKSPLELANTLIKTDNRTDILELLTSALKTCNNDQVLTNDLEEKVNSVHYNNLKQLQKKNKEFLYPKRVGTSGVSGQLYETKLLSLVLLRALNDDEIESFHLGTNITGIGALDDICMRYNVKGHANPIMLFVQAKHREDRESNRLTVADALNESGDFSLPKYLDSYLKIKENFRLNNQDDLFKGEFEDVECNLLLYTPAKDSFKRKRINKSETSDEQNSPNELSVKVNALIHTSKLGESFQFQYNEDDIECLTKMIVKDHIKKLGPSFLQCIMAEKDKLDTMMTDEMIKKYHLVLRREVIKIFGTTDISNTGSRPYHIATFRSEFFTSESEFLICLKETFYKEMSSKCCDKTMIAKGEVLKGIENLLENPCAKTLSKVISKIVKFNEKTMKLELIDSNNIKKEFKGNRLNQVKQSLRDIKIFDDKTIRDAVKIKLESSEFKLPISFGNLDMTVRGNRAKVSRRLDEVADKIVNKILKSCTETEKLNDIIKVKINDKIIGPGKDQLTRGFIDINGGIGSAIGNVLIQDEFTKLIKFDTINKLPPNANEFLEKIIQKIDKQELEKYRFKININDFPKYSFEGDEYLKTQSEHFLNKLWFYTNQAKENEVEKVLKIEITEHYNTERDKNQFVFRVHSDAIFLRSHDEIQKWWMKPDLAPYLTKTNDYFEQAKKEVIDSPLLTLLNLMYINKLKKLNIEFSKEAINALELNKIPEGLYNIVTEANVLSGIKLMQYFKDHHSYSFIDFIYILSLPLNDYNTMVGELACTKVKNLIIMYDTQKHSEGLCNKLKKIINTCVNSRIVIVTDSHLADEIKEYMSDKYHSIHDHNTYLIDLNEYSQNKILNEAQVIFQSEELPFSSLIDLNARGLIGTDILLKLLKGEQIEIGHNFLDQRYKDVKSCYIEQHLTGENRIKVDTLFDINDTTVVVSAKSGVGKSTLLSHLSFKTKQMGPLPWLVRINLPEHEREFRRWQEEQIIIDDITALQFISNAALKHSEFVKHLKQLDDGNIILANAEDITNPVSLFELKLFLLLFNNGNVIFLFDAFNAICPHYEKEVIKVLNVLKACEKRMWITTCSYRHNLVTIKQEFGNPYTLKPFNTEGRQHFLYRFFSTNLNLEKLNYDQFENIYSFMKYISKSLRLKREPNREFVPVLSLLFHYVYIVAAEFFKSEINHVSPSILNEKIKEEFDIDLNKYSAVDTILGRSPDDEELELASTPLHIYMVANYFKCRIEDCITFTSKLDENECRNKWDLIVNTCMLYKNFVEDELNRLLHEDDHDISTFSDNKMDFLNKHKKLGLFTICRENDLKKLLKNEEIIEIKETIKRIETGEEKSCLIDCVVNNVPRFGHLLIAEYFAMESLIDMLKKLTRDAAEGLQPPNFSSLWHTILNIILFKSPPGIRNAFNYKLQSDKSLVELTKSDMCQNVIFEMLLKKNQSSDSTAGSSRDTPIGEALQDRLFNIVRLFLSTVQCNLSRGNVDDVVGLIRESHLIFSNFRSEYKGLLDNLLESLKDLDPKKLSDIIRSGALTEVPLRHANQYCSSGAVHELTRLAAGTVDQMPAVVQNLQQIYSSASDIGATLGDALLSIAERGAHTYIDDFMNRLREAERK